MGETASGEGHKKPSRKEPAEGGNSLTFDQAFDEHKKLNLDLLISRLELFLALTGLSCRGGVSSL